MEGKKQNIFKQFILSLYSFKDYRHFAHTHSGKVFLYMLLLIALTYVVTFIIPTSSIIPYIYKLDTQMVDEYVPYFEVSGGEFYIEQEIYYEDEDGMSIVYATSDYVVPNDVAREILSAYMQGFIISADEMVFKQANGAIQEFSFSTVPDISRDSLYELIPLVKVFVVLLYIVIFIGYIGVYAFGTLVCALIGMLVNLFIKAPVTFGSVYKISTYARTAPILIKMLFALFTSFTLHFALFYVLFILYMVWALRALKRNEETPVPVQTQYGNGMPLGSDLPKIPDLPDASNPSDNTNREN